MRLTALALVFACLSASAAAAEPHGVAAAFGNTVKARYPDGRFQWLWLDADGSWEAFGRRGKWSSGKWSQAEAGKLCLKQAKPIPLPVRYCTAFPAEGGIGAVWSSKSLEGEPIRVTLLRGIQRP